MGWWSQDPERKEQVKKQDHYCGFQKIFWLFQRSALKSPMGYDTEEKRRPEELHDFQGSPHPSSRTVHLDLQKIKQKRVRQRIPGATG